MKDREIVILGAGGHAKVLISTLRACGWNVVDVFDDDREKWGQDLLGVSIGEMVARPGASAIIAIGNNSVRQRLATQPYRWESAVHPRAFVDSSVKLGQGSVVFAGAVIQPDAVVGEHVIVNTGATIDHDCVIGDFAHIAPGVHLAGGVRVGEGALVGIGSSVIPQITIGAWNTLGAGSVVVRDLPDGVVAFGVPAKPRTS